MSELFDAVDALIVSASPLPPPAERERLRKAHGLTQEQVANALKVRRATVVSWENGKTDPRPPQREAYARLLAQLAELYPANTQEPAPPRPPSQQPRHRCRGCPARPRPPSNLSLPRPRHRPAPRRRPCDQHPGHAPRSTTPRCREDPAQFLFRGC
ncbi:helix-turn-helix transcriptional regulator [Streptomyces sp. NPDC055157]